MFTDIERHGLLKFVPPNFLSVNVLVIDSPELLDELRKLLPAAQIAFMTTKRTHELEKICNDVRADLLVGNYLHGELPTAPKIFELILAQEILSAGETLYPTLLALNHLLTDSGALLTKFAEPTWTKARIVKLPAEVAALKELFTESTRAELSRLLHRIEYDIDVDENFSRLIKLCDREGIFDEYLTDFINQVVVHESAKDFIRARAENFGRVLNFDS